MLGNKLYNKHLFILGEPRVALDKDTNSLALDTPYIFEDEDARRRYASLYL